MLQVSIYGRQVAIGASLAMLIMLAGCGSSGRGMFLAGVGPEGVTPPAETGETPDDGKDGGGGGGGGKTGGGGGGGPSSGGIGGGGVKPPGTVVTGEDGVVSMVAQTGGGLLGGVLYTSGNATLTTTENLAPIVNSLPGGSLVTGVLQQTGETLSGAGQGVGENGLAGAPIVGPVVGQATTMADTALNGAATITVGEQTLVGSTTSPAPLGVSAASSGQAQGSVATVGVLSGGQTATLGLGAPTSGATAGVSASAPTSLLGVQAGETSLVGSGSTPLIGVSAGSTTPTQGSLLTLGAASNGQPASVALGGLPSSTDALLGGTASSPITAPTTVSGALAPVVAPVTNLVSPTATPTAAPAVLAPVTSLLSPVTNVVAPTSAPAPSVLAPVTGLLGGGLGGLSLLGGQ